MKAYLACCALVMCSAPALSWAQTAENAGEESDRNERVYEELSKSLQEDLSNALAMPQVPASALLAATPEQVSRPASFSDFGASVSQFVGPDGELKTGLAVEIAPWRMYDTAKGKPIDEFKPADQHPLLYRDLRISLASASYQADASEDAQPAMGVGFRLTLVDQRDYRHNPKIARKIRGVVTDVAKGALRWEGECNELAPDDREIAASVSVDMIERRIELLSKVAPPSTSFGALLTARLKSLESLRDSATKHEEFLAKEAEAQRAVEAAVQEKEQLEERLGSEKKQLAEAKLELGVAQDVKESLADGSEDEISAASEAVAKAKVSVELLEGKVKLTESLLAAKVEAGGDIDKKKKALEEAVTNREAYENGTFLDARMAYFSEMRKAQAIFVTALIEETRELVNKLEQGQGNTSDQEVLEKKLELLNLRVSVEEYSEIVDEVTVLAERNEQLMAQIDKDKLTWDGWQKCSNAIDATMENANKKYKEAVDEYINQGWTVDLVGASRILTSGSFAEGVDGLDYDGMRVSLLGNYKWRRGPSLGFVLGAENTRQFLSSEWSATAGARISGKLGDRFDGQVDTLLGHREDVVDWRTGLSGTLKLSDGVYVNGGLQMRVRPELPVEGVFLLSLNYLGQSFPLTRQAIGK